jgi:hypothetical protein
MLNEQGTLVFGPPWNIWEVAKAIYMANHGGFAALPNGRTAPVWEAASPNVKRFCLRQASAALHTAEDLRASD